MSIKLLSALLICFCLPVQAQTITWGTPVAVSSGGTGNLHPRVALNRNGDPYVLWGKTDAKAYFSKWNGSGFTTPVAVNPSSINVFAQSWAGPDIAAFGDTIYVAMKQTPENTSINHAFLSHSYDGGASFSSPVRVDSIDTNLSRFPIVTTTASGNPLVAFMKFNASFMNAQYVVCRSADYGNSFSTDVLASGSAGDVCDCCPAAIISSGSKAVMLFRNNLSNIRDIWAGVSNDGGATFPSLFAADNNNWNISSCPASGPDGFVLGDTLYSVFMSQGTGTARVYFSKSTLSGAALAVNNPITGSATGISLQNYPRIANAGKHAIAVWKQVRSGQAMLSYAFTTDVTAGLTGSDTLIAAGGLANADVALTPGYVHVVYEDDNSGSVYYVKGTYAVPSTAVAVPGQFNELNIYPNPAAGFFTFRPGKSNVLEACITDATGQKHAVEVVTKGDAAVVEISQLAKGGYFFSYKDETGAIWYSKLIIE